MNITKPQKMSFGEIGYDNDTKIGESLEPKIKKDLYCGMLRIRMVEEKLADLYPEQEMRTPVHLCIGQEAVPVGVCANLKAHDYVLSGHRSHGHYLAKGGNLKAMLAEIYGKATGCSKGKGGSQHIIDLNAGFLGATPIVGSTIPIAVGVAMASKMRDEPRVTVIFMGDAAAEEGVFHESLNYAVLKNLPVIFICENNLYSVYSPIAVRQSNKRKIFEMVKGYGLDSDHGDGNNVAEVYKLAGKAIKKARKGEGPAFFEFSTYRWREHCGPYYDNDFGYRTEEEFQEWKKRCPIKQFENSILQEGIIDASGIEDLKNQIMSEIEEAVLYAKESPFPDESSLMEDIYAE